MSRSGANNFTGTLGNANLISLTGESACCPDATEEETIASRDLKVHARERPRSQVTKDTLGASLRRCRRACAVPISHQSPARQQLPSSVHRDPSVLRRPGVVQPSGLGPAVSLENVEPGLEKPEEGYRSQS